ncbi:isoamylase 2, chloroplastic-like [Coffea arabica]|uniref:Isoamylase 2, chloroplastic-like n=1 Tax=Coffea arabica TaxID=13443 RepID=A0A6P6U0A2_COFAR|nr:isoamylase 2, chloroplastic-like [Coffea arabica]XP_027083968.1 isoamylase 2, chloroplastic-like [Coffea arabica]
MSVNMVLSPLASHNGCPLLSFTMQSHWLGCGAFESSKFVAAMRGRNAKGVMSSLMKLYAKDQRIGEVIRFSQRNSYEGLRISALPASNTSVIQIIEEVSSYQFRTENGDLLKVLVGKKNDKYSFLIKALSLQLPHRENELVMSWGLFRSHSSSFMPLDFQGSTLDGKTITMETPFMQESEGTLAVELDFELTLAPFYFSFLLRSQLDSGMSSLEIRSHRKTSFVVPVGFGSGNPSPLGLSFSADGSLNFALFSRTAESVVLCLYDGKTTHRPNLEIDLDPYVNKSGDIWHASIDRSFQFASYGYRCKVAEDAEQEHVLLDPYAKLIGDVPAGSQSTSLLTCLGQLSKVPPFDWGQQMRPCLRLEELVVYRLNVMRFTKDKSSNLPNNLGGSFLGVTEKLHHFKDLGVNAILLEPVFPFDEQKGPYFPWHFFSPANQYGSPGDPVSCINTMKEMVKKLHNNGIEVLLEVDFTHAAEVGALRIIDNTSYCHVKTVDDTGSEHALNCNYPVVAQLILDCLRHWVIEFHIDGFCFVNASSLLRGFHGEYLSRPPLVEAIAFDPLLSKVKIIADSWDPREMKVKEVLFPHWKKWAEINNKFCYDIRNFLRGEGLLSDLATRICGSGDVFLDGRGPAFSFNFIARNFGLSLVDLVSFSSSKLAKEFSWNCGEEGATNKNDVLERRLKQIRNFLFILFISLGVPVLNMGDECGQSSGGSPAYGDRNSFDWNALRSGFSIQTVQFISFLTSLRIRRSDLLQKRNFLREESIEWHGSNQAPPRWDDAASRFLAMTLKASSEDIESNSVPNACGDLFAAFNGADLSESITLPPPPADMVWFRLVDTALPFPGFFTANGACIEDGLATYEMKSHSCALFEARRPSE